jgi:hypothetical protein
LQELTKVNRPIRLSRGNAEFAISALHVPLAKRGEFQGMAGVNFRSRNCWS